MTSAVSFHLPSVISLSIKTLKAVHDTWSYQVLNI